MRFPTESAQPSGALAAVIESRNDVLRVLLTPEGVQPILPQMIHCQTKANCVSYNDALDNAEGRGFAYNATFQVFATPSWCFCTIAGRCFCVAPSLCSQTPGSDRDLK